MTSTSIGDALFTKTQQRVLALLYGEPGKSLYTNQIVRWAGMGRGTVRRELDKLRAADLLLVSHRGNQLHYQANPGSPVYPELVSLVRKAFGVANVLAATLKPIKSSIKLAFVYGSIAKGTEGTASDIDLMLIGDDLSYAAVMDLLITAEKQLGRPINPSIYTVAVFDMKLKQNLSFLERVRQQEKIIIFGSVDDIREPYKPHKSKRNKHQPN